MRSRKVADNLLEVATHAPWMPEPAPVAPAPDEPPGVDMLRSVDDAEYARAGLSDEAIRDALAEGARAAAEAMPGTVLPDGNYPESPEGSRGATTEPGEHPDGAENLRRMMAKLDEEGAPPPPRVELTAGDYAMLATEMHDDDEADLAADEVEQAEPFWAAAKLDEEAQAELDDLNRAPDDAIVRMVQLRDNPLLSAMSSKRTPRRHAAPGPPAPPSDADGVSAARTVTREEFLQSAGDVIRRAEAEGPVTVLGRDGAPAMTVTVPATPMTDDAGLHEALAAALEQVQVEAANAEKYRKRAAKYRARWTEATDALEAESARADAAEAVVESLLKRPKLSAEEIAAMQALDEIVGPDKTWRAVVLTSVLALVSLRRTELEQIVREHVSRAVPPR